LNLYQLIEGRISLAPMSPAVISTSGAISYRQLGDKISERAQLLATLGITSGSVVGISLPRSHETLINLLAVIKLSATYVPIDPNLPEMRKSIIKEYSNLEFIIDAGETQSTTGKRKRLGPAMYCDLISQHGVNIRRADPPVYIMYTSGSSGRPKGVAVSHANLIYFVNTTIKLLGLEKDHRFLASTTISFDISAFELILPLCIGAAIAVVDDQTAKDPRKVAELAMKTGVTVFQGTPIALELLLSGGWKPTAEAKVICGGEVWGVPLAKTLLSHGVELWNAYGPTEATIWTSYRKISEDEVGVEALGLPIAKHFGNSELLLLDERMFSVPVGQTGQLYISGPNVTAGYLEEARVATNAFLVGNSPATAGKFLYRTGDRMLNLSENDMRFIGRMDDQIKIDGIRIEPREIEELIEQYPTVRKALVHALDFHGSRQLVAFYQLTNEQAVRQITDAWEGIYNALYERSSSNSSTGIDLAGWVNSATQQSYSREEMEVWAKSTVDRIVELKPTSVVEIGAGSGLIAIPMMPHCTRYLAIEPSEIAVSNLSAKLNTMQSSAKCRVVKGSAHVLRDIFSANEQADTFILNSVVQYFPDINYLERVLNCIAEQNGLRCIFIGDIRNFRLQEHEWLARLMPEASSEAKWSDLSKRIESGISTEEELLIAPEFFMNLRNTIPGINEVEILPKAYLDTSEMSKFRYDVIIHFGKDYNDLPQVVPQRLQWSDIDETFSLLLASTEALVIEEIKNERIECEQTALDDMDARGLKPARLLQLDEESRLASLAEKFGLTVKFYLATGASSNRGALDAVFQRSKCRIKPNSEYIGGDSSRAWANIPNSFSSVSDELEEFLKERLPQHMAPLHYLAINAFPQTPSGKIDAAALIQSAEAQLKQHSATGLGEQEAFQQSWRKVLGLNRTIGRDEDFFQLGGNSMSAVRLAALLSQHLERKITIMDIFAATTIRKQKLLTSERSQTKNLKKLERTGRDRFKASPSQQQFWLLDSRKERGYPVVVVDAVSIDGHLDVAALARSLTLLLERHDALRTALIYKRGALFQHVKVLPDSVMELHDLTTLNCEEARSATIAIAKDLSSMSFDLMDPPLLRAVLVKETPTQSTLVLAIHHIATDTWSMNILYKDLGLLYNALVRGLPTQLPRPAPPSFIDYTIWLEKQRSVEMEAAEYWTEALRDLDTTNRIPLDNPRQNGEEISGDCHRSEIQAAHTPRILAICEELQLTPFMLMNAALSVFVRLYSMSDDVCIGTLAANRSSDELSEVVGYFSNPIVLRNKLERGQTVRSFLQRVKHTATRALEHQSFPFERVVSDLSGLDENQGSPFQVLLAQEDDIQKPHLFGVTTERLDLNFPECHFDLELKFSKPRLGVHTKMGWTYNSKVFRAATITTMAEHFQRILNWMIEDIDRSLDSVSLSLGPYSLENPELPKEDGSALHKDIVRNFRSNGEKLAIIDDGKGTSYKDIYASILQIRILLRKNGVRKGQLVAIDLSRSANLVAATLAVWSLRAHFILLSSNTPIEYKRRAVLRLQPVLVIANDMQRNYPSAKEISLAEELSEWQNIDKEDQELNDLFGDDIAYINLTSGSTGEPKAVAVSNRALGANVKYTALEFAIGRDDQILQVADAAFDVFISDVFRALSVGGTIIICPDEVRSDPRKLANFIGEHKITLFECVPVLANSLAAELTARPLDTSSLRLIILGGEKVFWADVDRLWTAFGSGVEIVNSFGSTETVIDNTFHKPKLDDKRNSSVVPIGKPHLHCSIYILDRHMVPVPFGVWGVIVVGGVCLSEGYIGVSQSDSFRNWQHPTKGVTPVYWTGDIGRVNIDGLIEIAGRSDDLVKVRGQRIQLNAIRSILLDCNYVEDAEVIFDSESQAVWGFVKVGDAGFSADLVVSMLRAQFPLYMIPSAIFTVDTFPVTNLGKIDKKALAKMAQNKNVIGDSVAMLDAERVLADIWCDIIPNLTPHQVSPKSDFFQVGGHSLLVYKCIERIKEVYSVSLPARVLFEFRSLREICAEIRISAESGKSEEANRQGFFLNT
jgi:amino acid adenylation domain-containing protein